MRDDPAIRQKPAPAPWRALRGLVFAVLALAGMLALAVPQPAAQGNARTAVLLDLDGAVSPATADYLIRGIGAAAEEGAALVIIRMDTPGGLETSMRDIIRAILASPVPVATHVAPSGARAASAGTYILYASHVAAMAPSTTLGAATPVAIGGGGLPFGGGEDEAEEGERPARPADAAAMKAINDAVAHIRGLAELRGRNADWAEKAVREAATLTASAAVEENVADFIARDTAELLALAHGRSVTAADVEIVLDTETLQVIDRAPDWRTKLLAVITNPNVAVLLMVLGFYGLLFEFYNPGVLVPGTVGAISLLTGMFALSILPFSYAGLALIALGLALVLAEAFSPSFGILGIGGTVAIVLGAVLLFDSDVPGLEMSWPAIGALAVASLAFSLLVARLAMVSHRRKVTTGAEEMIGARARVLDWDGSAGHVFVHGERWQARGDGTGLVPGQMVEVTRVDGLVLMVAARDANGTGAATG